jgi:hypothetical protein
MAFAFTIPDAGREPLRELATLSEEQVSTLVGALEKIRRVTTPGKLIKLAAPDVKDVREFPGIVGALVNLRVIIDTEDFSLSQVAAGVAAEAKRSKLIAEEQQADALRTRLKRLLSLRSVTITSKAFALFYEHRAPFSSARLLSDVRPVFFDEEGQPQLVGSILVHTLKIDCIGQETYFVALRPQHLRRLQESIERAIQKEERIRESLAGGPSELIDEESDEEK